MSGTLVLVRHGQSDWNLKNLFTGWKDPDLTEKGVTEAREAGRKLKAHGLTFDVAFTSALTRAQHTLRLALEEYCRAKRLPSRRTFWKPGSVPAIWSSTSSSSRKTTGATNSERILRIICCAS